MDNYILSDGRKLESFCFRKRINIRPYIGFEAANGR